MYNIIYSIEADPDKSYAHTIREAIIEFNWSILKETTKSFCVVAKNDEQVVGGALLYQQSDAIYIDILWCHEDYRKQGIGSQIIKMIEQVAFDNNIHQIFVDTYGFQAEKFYQSHGFNVIAVVPKYLCGYDKIFLQKLL
jgi:N-acetylglutamate synthase-like GNAT family acetyltransferase